MILSKKCSLSLYCLADENFEFVGDDVKAMTMSEPTHCRGSLHMLKRIK